MRKVLAPVITVLTEDRLSAIADVDRGDSQWLKCHAYPTSVDGPIPTKPFE